jgi:hypothetical protein
MADKAYSSKAIRTYLLGRGIECVIPEKDDQKANRKRKGPAGGRPVTYDKDAYKRRNVVERSFNTLKTLALPGHPLRQTGPHLRLSDRPARRRHLEHPIGRHVLAAAVQVKPVPQFGTGDVDASRGRGIIPSRRGFHLSEANST